MSTAQPSDVRGVIDTSLSDSEITSFLEDAEFEAKDAIEDYANALTTTEKRQLEKYLAALYVRTTKERPFMNQSGESRSVSYDIGVGELRAAVSKRDPSGSLASGVLRDSDRYVSST